MRGHGGCVNDILAVIVGWVRHEPSTANGRSDGLCHPRFRSYGVDPNIHPNGQEFGDLTLVFGPPLPEPDGGAFTSTNHGHKARGLDVGQRPVTGALGRHDPPAVSGSALPIHHMPWMGSGARRSSPALLVLCLPCDPCDGLRWKAMPRGRVRTSLRTVA